MFNYNKKFLKRDKNGSEAPGWSDIANKNDTIIDTSTLTTEELESRLASLEAWKIEVAWDTKDKLSDLYVKMLTESGMTFNNKEELHNFIIKLNSFGYEVRNNDSLTALFEYMPDFIQDNSSIRINWVLSGETKMITLWVDVNPLNNDQLEITKQHTVEEILMPELPKKYELPEIDDSQITDENIQVKKTVLPKEVKKTNKTLEKKVPKMTKEEVQAEYLRKNRVNELIKRYRKWSYKDSNEMNWLVQELYNKKVNVSRKTTPSEMDNFERAMDAVDYIVDKQKKQQQVDKQKKQQQVVEVSPIDESKQEVVKKYSPEVQAVFDKLNTKKPYGPNNKMVLGHITIKTDNPVKVNDKFMHIKLSKSEVADYNEIVDQKNDLNTKRKEVEDAEPSLWDKLTSTEKKEKISEIKVATSKEFEEVLLKLANKKPYGPNNKNTLGNITKKSTFRVKTIDGKYKSVKLSSENNIIIDGKKYSQLSLYNKIINDKNALNIDRKTNKKEDNTSILDSISDMFFSNEWEKRLIANNNEFDTIMNKLNSKKPYGPKNKTILGSVSEKTTFRVRDNNGEWKSVRLDKDQVNVYNSFVDQKNKWKSSNSKWITSPAEAAKVAAKKQAGLEWFSFGDLWNDLTSSEKWSNIDESEQENIATEKLNKFLDEVTASKTDNFWKKHEVSSDFKDFLKRRFSLLYRIDKPFSINTKWRTSGVSEKIGKVHRKLTWLETHMYNELVNEGIRARLPADQQKVWKDTELDKNMEKALWA